MNENELRIPKTLDNLPRFFMWDIYQAMIFLLIFGFSVVLHMIVWGFIIGAGLAWGYGRLASGQRRGFLVHLLYWFTPMGKGYKVLPDSNKRYFQG
jgi:type IV conjugative transfer system protein TraL